MFRPHRSGALIAPSRSSRQSPAKACQQLKICRPSLGQQQAGCKVLQPDHGTASCAWSYIWGPHLTVDCFDVFPHSTLSSDHSACGAICELRLGQRCVCNDAHDAGRLRHIVGGQKISADQGVQQGAFACRESPKLKISDSAHGAQASRLKTRKPDAESRMRPLGFYQGPWLQGGAPKTLVCAGQPAGSLSALLFDKAVLLPASTSFSGTRTDSAHQIW